jgi:predicted TIM-barrel fold metal-dependent hydrolase
MSNVTGQYLPFKTPLREPTLRLPKGSVDCHFHVFEDPDKYPYTENRSYTPTLAPWAAFEAMNDLIGADRAVLVHPSVYGHDHATFIDTLKAHPNRLRGVAVLRPDTSPEEIAALDAIGAKGTRLNVLFAGGNQLSDGKALAKRVAPFGWHLQFLADVAANPELPAWASSLNVPVVFDHFGHPSVADCNNPGFKNLCALVKEGQAWVKISGAYRVVSAEGCWSAIDPFVEALLKANPERLVWGTDWPHPSIGEPMPDDVDLAEMVFRWLPDEALRQQILVKNPEVLYGFPQYVEGR